MVDARESNGSQHLGTLAERPRVLVIDRQALVVAALSRLLSGPPLDADVITATRSSDVVEIMEETRVDVIVCEVKARPVSGPELATMVTNLHPAVKVIILADGECDSLLPAALLSGAAGFFMKESPPEEFVAGVATVLQGQCVIGGGLLERAVTMLANRGNGPNHDRLSPLSPAEFSILALLAQAQSIRSIAEARGISPKTVRNHLAIVYRKLKVRNRAEAMLWAARMGMVALGTS